MKKSDKPVKLSGRLAEREEVSNLKNQLARALADYDNLRKRVEKEKEIWVKTAGGIILLKMISILDILLSAQKHLNDKGLELAISEFKKVLGEEDLEEIVPQKGERFDKDTHEVVETAGDGEKGRVSELILSGWKYRDGPVLRYAKVKVIGEPSEKKEELEKELQRGEYV